MNKKIVTILGVVSIPVGGMLLSSCGPEAGLVLDEASDGAVVYDPRYGEYGQCNDGWDNDGNGLKDSEDPRCHTLGPLRDLSLFDSPQGHNFFPDNTKVLPGSPGFAGSFRNRAMTTDWLRFLTEPDGNVAGIDVYGAGVNPEVVPLPMPLPRRVPQGTLAQGNNNNLSGGGLHHEWLYHNFLAGSALPPVAGVAAPIAGAPASTAAEFHPINGKAGGNIGGWPGLFYRNGSQGALEPTRTR